MAARFGPLDPGLRATALRLARDGIVSCLGVLSTLRLILPSDAGVASDLDVLIPFGNDLAAGPRGLYYENGGGMFLRMTSG